MVVNKTIYVERSLEFIYKKLKVSMKSAKINIEVKTNHMM
ncbi:hypothetical protein RV06_GL002494 [Enterococcus haemoperoxidus]|nr:hypothetical protein RV06_GL002494 [Enterococcus haemoperoxidus]